MLPPPPWLLTGEGIVLVGHFPEAFVRQQGFLTDYQQAAYKGWIGAVILANYHTSGVGPYQELLFIPGLFRMGGRLTFSISKIYVSTSDSALNGLNNWGIPKEVAQFTIGVQPDGTYQASVSQDNTAIFNLQVKHWGLRFPITSKLIPGLSLTQLFQQQLLRTHLAASGKARLATIQQLAVNKAHFPQISSIRPLVALSLTDITLTFPVPKLLKR